MQPFHRKHISKFLRTAIIASGVFFVTKHLVRRQRHMPLAGRTILITGGSRGLGLALARECVRHSAKVAVCARDAAELAIVKTEMPDVEVFTCDLSDADQASALIDKVEAAVGPIDLLINNAATIIVGPAQNMGADDFRQAMDLNFWAAVHLTLALAPKMKTRGGGRIVNIASVGGKMPVPHLAPYCASKFALVGFSGAMRAELLADNIHITTVNPGLMRTGSPRNADFKGQHEHEYAWFSIADALPGFSMSAEDAARKILYAAINGDAEVTLGLPTKLAAASYGLAPGVSLELAALINRLLPAPSPIGQLQRKGRDSESWITRFFRQKFSLATEKKYNQLNHEGDLLPAD